MARSHTTPAREASGRTQAGNAGGDHSLAHPAPLRHAAPLVSLWIGLFGGFFAFAFQILLNFFIASYSCFSGRIPQGHSPQSWVWWTMVAVATLAFLATAMSMWAAYSSWGATHVEASRAPVRRRKDELLEIGEGRTRFMAMAGLVTSGILLATVFMNATALLIMPLCRVIP
ncbi:MAG: hypothetical protein R3D44_00215 [Hyphomicrobiaceae bacterium]